MRWMRRYECWRFFPLFNANFLNRVAGSPWEVSVTASGIIGPKISVIGDTIRLVPANQVAVFQIHAIGFKRNDVHASVSSS